MLARNILLALGAIAVALSLVIVIVWIRLPQEGATPQKVVTVPTAAILVAARPIPVSTLLRVQDMDWSEIPATAVTGSNFVRGKATMDELVGAVTRRALAERQPLTADAIAKPGDRDFLVATLAPGYRAVSIAVNAAQSGSGLMLPGDRVDVVLTQSFSAQGTTDPSRRSVGETVLRDLRIIAVDQTLTATGKASDPKLLAAGTEIRVPRTITLEVREQEAEALLVAEQLGQIQLTLRGDSPPGRAPPTAGDDSPTWASDVSPALKSLGAPPPVTTGGGAIEVIHGTKSERLCPSPNGYAACR